MSDEIQGISEDGVTRFIKAYEPGELPEPGDVVWSYEFHAPPTTIGPRIIPKDGDEGTVVL